MEYKRLNDKISLNIICPGCQKSTKYYQLNQYPRDAEVEEHIKNDNDLVMPTEWTEAMYTTIMKNFSQELIELYGSASAEAICTTIMKNLRLEQREQKIIIDPILCHINNHYELCRYSDRDVVLLSYYMFRYDEKTAVMTFRIITVLPQRVFKIGLW